MKIGFSLLFLTCIQFKGLGQNETSRFSIKPQIGLGMVFPGRQTQISGSERMNYAWKATQVGSFFDATGSEKVSIKSTNRLGLQFGYFIAKNLELGLGANRTTLISAYNPTFQYNLDNGNLAGTYYENITYYDFNATANLHFGETFFVIQPHFIPDIFSNSNRKNQGSSSGSNDFRNRQGTGMVFTYDEARNQNFNLFLAFGKNAEIMDIKYQWQLGINIVPTPLYKESVTFYTNRRQVAENQINFSTNSVFLTINTPINFKARVPKIPREKPKKAAKPKNDIKNPRNQENRKVEIGNKTISAGENLVLDNIQFEQTKASLNPKAMADLDFVFTFLKEYPNSIIEITGHTSTEGNKSDNIELSRKRAEECKSYLLKKGIKANRIKAYGIGPNRPISKSNQEMNRRVELKIISIE